MPPGTPRTTRPPGLGRALAFALASSVVAAGCGGDTPETRAVRTAKAFVTAVRTDNTKALVSLLEAQAVAELEGTAALASEHVGGRRTIEAHEMLQVVDLDPLFQVERVEVVDLDAQLAVVEVTATSGEKVSLTLIEEGGRWKVRVPSPASPGRASSGGASSGGASSGGASSDTTGARSP
jgi:hypothetical protein